MAIFSMIILVFFAIIGLSTLIAGLLDAMCKSKTAAVLTLSDLLPDTAEARIRSAARICLRHKGIRLQCVCDEKDPAFDICALMQKEYPFLEIISSAAKEKAP